MNDFTSQKKLALGTITKSHSVFDSQRITDYLLQDQASKLLQHKFRVKYCLKRKIRKDDNVSVCFNESTSKAHFGNVIRCGSVWVCPVCAKKITENRRNELSKINQAWKNGITLYSPIKQNKQNKTFIGPPVFTSEKIENGYTYLITLTNPHYACDRLTTLKEKQKEAMKLFFSNRKGRFIFDKLLGKRFHITNYEVTYGKNGWHPHHHILIFSDKYLSIHDFTEIHEVLANHWSNCLHKSGIRRIKDNEKYIACDLRDGTYAEKYISKWGIEHELTKGHIKKGRDSLTAFDLLRLSDKDDFVFEKQPSKLFQEFAIAFKGCKQLVYSRGLKHSFAIQDKSDDEIMNEVLEEAILLTTVEDLVFRLLIKYKKRAQFLDCITNDYLNGCFGNGSAEQLLNDLVTTEIMVLEEQNNQSFSIGYIAPEPPEIIL